MEYAIKVEKRLGEVGGARVDKRLKGKEEREKRRDGVNMVQAYSFERNYL